MDRLAPPVVDARAELAHNHVEAGAEVELTIELMVGEGWTLEVGQPQAEGLEVVQVDEEGPARVGQRSRTLRHYSLAGEPGSYVIYPGVAEAAGPQDQSRTIEMPPLFVDVGVEGPSGGEMAGFTAAPPRPTPVWVWVAERR
jgi:hypothetical protein